MATKAPEALGVPGLSFPEVAGLDQLGIQYVHPQQVIHCGKLNILHGHEFARGIASPVNPARGAFLKTHANSVVGHLHRGSNHTHPNVRGKVVSTWSHGCML